MSAWCKMSIKPLPPEVIAQIRSSITITSLNGVISELVKNSLDAGASKLEITVDYSRGACVVEDDGHGILPSDFKVDGGLGKLYHTSKLEGQIPLHGSQGTFIAALSAMSLLSISSRHHLHRSHNSMSMHKSEVISRQTPTTTQQHSLHPDHGTKVSLRDLFGNMPVRVKQRVLSDNQKVSTKEREELKREIMSLLLAWSSSVAVILRDSVSNQKWSIRPGTDISGVGPEVSTLTPSVCRMLSQGGFIAPDEKESWVAVGASTAKLKIRGTISLLPSANKHTQFSSMGIYPISTLDGQNVLHDEINRLFSNSAFGVDEDLNELNPVERERRSKDRRYKGDGYTLRELKGVKKGVDRWPMFYINIQLGYDNAESLSKIDDILDDQGPSLPLITELLQTMIFEFLQKHHFRPRNYHGRRFRTSIGTSSAAHVQRNNVNLNSRDTEGRQIELRLSPDRSNNLSAKPIGIKSSEQRDLLGTNVRFPSFRQDIFAHTAPLQGWSKIKKGANISRPTTPKEPCGSLTAAQIVRSSSAPPSIIASTAGVSPISTAKSIQSKRSLVSQAGRILRAPFQEALTSRPHRSQTAPSFKRRSDTECADKKADVDDPVIWINPVTKARSLVNKRTGHTVKSRSSLSTSERTISSSRLSSAFSEVSSKPRNASPWIRDILQGWDNPIFSPAEASIPAVSFDGPDAMTQQILHGRHHHCSQIDINRAFKESSSGTNARISKEGLKQAQVVAQVDNKFILVRLQSSQNTSMVPSHDDGANMLVLIDQHAADERIRVEALMQELFVPSTTSAADDKQHTVAIAPIEKPLNFEISRKELALLETHKDHFARWGILYNSSPLVNTSVQRLAVHSLPPAINERCKLDPRMLIELIRTELWKMHEQGQQPRAIIESGDWLQRIHTCPQGILDMLNSRACRSAIMFNDVLSRDQCDVLVKKLADCKFPFQCAHGRPSLVPLVDLRALKLGLDVRDTGIGDDHEARSFGAKFRKWKEEST